MAKPILTALRTAFLLILTAIAASIAAALPLDRGWSFRFVAAGKSTPGMDSLLFAAADTGIAVPHTFNNGERFGQHKQGSGWYARTVHIPAQSAGTDLLVRFEGVCLRAQVYGNGRFLGSSAAPYLPFEVPIPWQVVRNDTVRLIAEVNNQLLDEDIPDRSGNGWWLYGGLIGEVSLISRPPDRLTNVQVSTGYLGPDSFETVIAATCVGQVVDSVDVCIRDKHGVRIAGSRILPKQATIRKSLRIGRIHAWTPDSPVLYDFLLTPWYKGRSGLPVYLRRGFAHLQADSTRLRLNGVPIHLRGVGRHDVGDTLRPLLTRTDRLRDLLTVKRLNCNFLRIAHYPQHRDVYEICDSLGILVMDEIPAWKTSATFLSSPAGAMRCKKYLTQLVAEHGNFTCIGLWSIGNEFQSIRPELAGFVKGVAEHVRAIDPMRLVTYCSYFYQFDQCYDYLDVISVNEYFGWYVGSLDLLVPMLRRIHQLHPNKPILISEFGAAAEIGKRNIAPKLAGIVGSMTTKDLSEDHQALYLRSHLAAIRSIRDICVGSVAWCFADFLEPRQKPRTSEYPRGINTLGILTMAREPKQAFDSVKEVYGTWARADSLEKATR